jgi:cytochrome c oxidase cbb3-type subunit 3
MAEVERDPISGRETTGHEWNGIKELDTPVPRGVLMFLIVTHVWAIVWWFFVPSWPLGETYTKGLLGVNQRTTVEARVVEGQQQRASWTARIETEPYDVILADEALMETVRDTGQQLFGDNCAACHGESAQGSQETGAPNLTDSTWVYGGDLDTIIASVHGGRQGHMPTWDERLTTAEIRTLALYVHDLGTRQP